jgi:hypothetical protein
MFYDFPLAIPRNTLASAPVQLEAVLVPGVVTRVELVFPRGCFGLAHVQIWEANHQLWPSNPDEDFAADDEVLRWSEEQPLTLAGATLTLKGWNDDDAYQHTVRCRFAVTEHSAFERQVQAQRALAYLARWFEDQ